MNLERLSRITVEEGKCEGRPCIFSSERPAIDYAVYQTDHVVLRT